jgi:hypothetical protein
VFSAEQLCCCGDAALSLSSSPCAELLVLLRELELRFKVRKDGSKGVKREILTGDALDGYFEVAALWG